MQRAYIFRASTLIAVTTISSGQPGYDTPVGRYTILEKQVTHHSNLYENAPMPFMQRLTVDGIALHAGQVMAEPASHGCIRMAIPDVIEVYDQVPVGAPIYIA